MKLDEDKILSIVGAELTQATNGTFNSELDGNREEALDYYLGNLPGAAEEGRSQAVSTDVADAIEWILPQIIKAMIGKGPIITFDAISAQDEEQAAVESAFVHSVFMSDNPGFLNLYEFVKDALMQKNGIFKVYFDDTPDTTKEQYDGLMQNQIEMLAMDGDVEITVMEPDELVPVPPETMQQFQMQMQQYQQQMSQMQQQQQPMQQPQPGMGGGQQMQQQQQPPPPPQEPQPQQLFHVELTRTCDRGRVVVESVPPEEFRVNEYHNSLDLQDARFTAQVVLKTRSELLEAGYDEQVVEDAPTGSENLYQREYRWNSQDEGGTSSENSYSDDTSQDLIEVSECYMMIDMDDSGIAELHKITTLGGTSPTDILDVEPVEENPFVSSSCIIMPHKFNGLSIFDRLKQIQDQKTSLWRNVLDNLYLQNNREKEVVEDQVNLDDLLISRPGGIKRVKQPGMIRELQIQPIGQEGYQMLDYLDSVRTGRVGVSPDTMGASLPVGGDTAHGVERMMSAKEELTALMIRSVAETGLKAAYVLIRDLLVRHKKGEESFKYRGDWAKINPSTWGKRSRTTVTVGTGTGDDMRKQGALREVIGYQTQLAASGETALIDEERGFNALDEFCQSTGLQGGEKYFLDPKSPQGKEKRATMDKQQQEMQQKMDEMNAKIADAQTQMAQAEMAKGQAALQGQQVKAQSEQAKVAAAEQKLMLEGQISTLKQQLDEAKAVAEAFNKDGQLKLDTEKLTQDTQTKIAKLESDMAIAMLKLKHDDEKLQSDNVNAQMDRAQAAATAAEDRDEPEHQE